MGQFLPLPVCAGALAAVMGCFARVAVQVRRRAPMASPDDPWSPLHDRRELPRVPRARGPRRPRNAAVRWWRHGG
ncbi:hypothetical protein E6P78_29595 [Streptomyces sp. A0958]|uniref:hypothetical protein n=1 Tax=Streptomyces sp. A0958 TaxID=2563101 RepID=UPI00109E99F2|nr:hypothetical protein [Streptomyces sp. A0958]THA59458.1 hypothetical protein E6P78_29595 [Streptomyces sp. A0958]